MTQALAASQYAVSDIERMARAFAGSKLFGVQNPEQALALCLIAQAEGRHPASAAQDYHIIQGRPAKKSDAMLRDFLNAGGKVEWHKLDDEIADATFSHPSGGSVRISWDMQRAIQAKLSTDMWRKYPRQMLRARIVSEGVRTVFPMATSGMYVPEEVREFDTPAETGPKVVTIDGEAVPQPSVPAQTALPKAKTRDTYKELQAEVDACLTVDDLKILWKSKPFQAEFGKLAADWGDQLIDRFNGRLADLRESEQTPSGSQSAEASLDAQFPGDRP